jgi:hypothetical protein
MDSNPVNPYLPFVPKTVDKFARGERVVCAKGINSGVDGFPLLVPGDTGTVIFREPLANYEVYHVALDAPRDSLYAEMLVMPDYLEAEK